MSLNDILHRLRLLLRIPQSAAVLLTLFLAVFQLLPDGGQLLLHRFPALGDLGSAGGDGGQLRPPIGGGCHRHGLPRTEHLRLRCRALGAVSQLLCLMQQGVQLLLHRRQLCVNVGCPRQLAVDLPLQVVPSAVAVGQLLLQTAQGLLVVGHAGAQHRHGGLLLAHGALQPIQTGAQGLGVHVVLPHLLAAALALLIGGVQCRLRPAALLRRQLRVGLQLQLGRADILQLLQPHGDLQHPQLIPQHQKFLGGLRLLAQRLHLQFQLGDLVVDAHQILLRALQLALGLLLAVAILADARRLLKDLAALAAFHGQDLVDLALSDDGVALPAHAGVHEQLIHVLEPDGLLVDVILRLAAAVVPAGHRHLRLVAGGENMLRVVDDQRHLREAHLVALLRTAEDDVLHLGAPELAAVLLAHDPADGVGDVGLAGAVGTYNGRDILPEVQYRLIGERFEPLYFQSLKVDRAHPFRICIL